MPNEPNEQQIDEVALDTAFPIRVVKIRPSLSADVKNQVIKFSKATNIVLLGPTSSIIN